MTIQELCQESDLVEEYSSDGVIKVYAILDKLEFELFYENGLK